MPNTEKELSESPDSPDEEREELDERLEQARDWLMHAYGESLDQVQKEVADMLGRTEVLTFESQGLSHAQTRIVRDPLEASSSSEGQERNQQLEDNVQKILDSNGASNGSGDDGNGGNKNASHNAKRYIVGAIGIVVIAGLGILFEEIYRKSNKKGDADVPLTEDEKKKIGDLVDKWQALDDKTFWGNLVDYVQKNPFTLADMVYFMQYAQQCFPLTEPFLWDKFQDKTDIVNSIEKAYSVNKSMADTINTLPTLTYKNAPLPRNIQASCAQLAFADIANSLSISLEVN